MDLIICYKNFIYFIERKNYNPIEITDQEPDSSVLGDDNIMVKQSDVNMRSVVFLKWCSPRKMETIVPSNKPQKSNK